MSGYSLVLIGKTLIWSLMRLLSLHIETAFLKKKEKRPDVNDADVGVGVHPHPDRRYTK